MPKVAVNDIEVYYEVHGKGDPVMLITGLGGVGATWGPQIPLFAKEFLTIVPDHRGTGRTSFPKGGYSIEQHASDMAETVRTLKTGPAHIVGSSTGGAIAQVMALDHPDAVRSLVLSSTWAKTDGFFRLCFEARKQILKELGLRPYWNVASTDLWSPRYIREHYEDFLRWEEGVMSGADVEIMMKRIDMIVAHDQLSRVGKIKKPTLIIVGREDVCTPPYFSEELARAILGAELAILDGAHFFYLENPQPYYARVREFLVRH